jgi:acyl-CoA thioesterase 8
MTVRTILLVPFKSFTVIVQSSLDHSIWYYEYVSSWSLGMSCSITVSDDFCCEDGLLYVVGVPRFPEIRLVYPSRRLSVLEQRLVEQWSTAGCVLLIFVLGLAALLTLSKLYSRAGKLVAVTCQEGVVRANRRGPTESKAKL